VDLRIDSPGFGKWDTVAVDSKHFRAVYFPVGVGHAFISLQDDTVMSYLFSGEYVAETSSRSPCSTLAEALERGLLPHYDKCKAAEEALSH